MTNTPPKTQIPQIFDRAQLFKNHERIASKFGDHDFLHQIIVDDLIDRLETVLHDFDNCLITGLGAADLIRKLTPKCGVKNISEGQLNSAFLNSDAEHQQTVMDIENYEFGDNQFDLIVSIMELHATNDLPNILCRIRKALKPDGLFLAAMAGENTLTELRQSLQIAESEILGGVSPHIFPFAAIKDLGALLQRAQFNLPVADQLRLPVTYRDPYRLLTDLRYMGEGNILNARKRTSLRRDVLHKVMEIYRSKYKTPDETGVLATFDIVMLTGWAHHPSQQKPLKPGSAKSSLEAAIKTSSSN